jgi:hypothetical protein
MQVKAQRKRMVGFNRPALTPNPPKASKVDFIRKGKKKKTITNFKEKKNVTYENHGGKFIVVEKEKKIEIEGVTRKKRNYVMYESKLGTEKERDTTRIASAKLRRPILPRIEEKIIIKKKRKEYLDNYQYHETKVIRNPKPRNTSYVEHKRLGDIVGGTVEHTTYERQFFRTDGGAAAPRQYSTGTRNRTHKVNPVSLTYNSREFRSKLGQLSNSMASRNKRPIEKAPTDLGKLNDGTEEPTVEKESEFRKYEKRTILRNGRKTTTERTFTGRRRF